MSIFSAEDYPTKNIEATRVLFKVKDRYLILSSLSASSLLLGPHQSPDASY